MSGFTEYQASDASAASGRYDTVMTWATAQSMLPLVRRIIADILEQANQLRKMHPEKDRLDRHRRDLAWPERSRRYQLDEEIRNCEAKLQEARGEMDTLGVALIDVVMGQIGFPTLVNNRRAFFSWRPGEEEVDFWHYA